MLYASIFIFLLMFLLNTMFKIASLFRLGIPLIYVLAVPIFFPDFLHKHEMLATDIFFALLGFVVLSWVVSMRKKLQHRREQNQFTGINSR